MDPRGLVDASTDPHWRTTESNSGGGSGGVRARGGVRDGGGGGVRDGGGGGGNTKELEKVAGMLERGRLVGSDKIGVRVGRVINKYKMAKHFELDIKDDHFGFQRKQEAITAIRL